MSAVAVRGGFALPRFDRGTVEMLKWAALLLMTLDHVDAFVFHRELGWATQLGRLVFPVFAVIFGMNLARSDARAAGVYGRVLWRLAVFGLLAQPFHGVLTGAAWGLFPLNVMATFAVAVGVIWLLDSSRELAAAAVLAVAGGFVEYRWPGVLLVVGVWLGYRQAPAAGAAVALAALVALYPINGSHAALWVVPLLWLVSRVRWSVPRWRWAFYVYYPAHLAVFALLVPRLPL